MIGFLTERHGKVLEVVIDRPKANALDSSTSQALNEVFTAFNMDPSFRVAVITGAGDRFFCAGGDVAELDRTGGNVDYGRNGFAGLTHFQLRTKPVIAAVNGFCVGGGLEMVLGCDLIVASDNARFSLTETRIGSLPYLVSIQRILQRLPVNIASEMLYTGRRLSAKELRLFGVVNHVLPHDELRNFALRLAADIAASAPLSITAVQRAIKHFCAPDDDGRKMDFDELEREFASVMKSEDAKEGAAAFTEKRRPRWQGR